MVDLTNITFWSDAIPIVFEESTYSVEEQAGTLEICAVAPASLDVSVAVTVQATGGTAIGNSTVEHQNHDIIALNWPLPYYNFFCI